ncbi:ATP-dependent translocase ABCB1-like isoform X2 [Pecten maximus]|uniref:ATP-dependent translocase ABCB1-like isoform X2 n=1 Tax=Pecten maximus TaxID=6579 RepID=UPI001458EA8C|nr:ATP-dependent translocase ABCB1-like isoform X2 [Pecten maximus]
MPEPKLMGYTPTGVEGSAANNHSSEPHSNGQPKVEYSAAQSSNGKVGHKDSEDETYKANGRSAADVNRVALSDEKHSAKSRSSSEKTDEDGKEKKEEEETQMVGLFEVFKFATCGDVFLMILGSILACCHGAALPGMIIVFGDMIDLFVNSGLYSTAVDSIYAILVALGYSLSFTRDEAFSDPELLRQYRNVSNISSYLPQLDYQLENSLLDKMGLFAIYYIIIGVGVLVVGYGQVTFWAIAAERQSHRIRQAFFKNVVRQEIGWFDTHESGELNTRLSDDINKIHAGIGDKLGSFWQWFSGFLAGFAIGFYYGWKLTLVILAISPLLAATGFVMNKLVGTMSSLELKAYAKAGAVAEEVLSSIRTVVAFGGQKKEFVRYDKNLEHAKAIGVKKSLTSGLSMGLIWFIMMGSYALGFWYGAKLVREDGYSIGKVLIVFFSVLIGAFSLGNAAPHLQSLAVARGAAYIIYQMIEQKPDIDSESKEGKKPNSIHGNVDFQGVRFTYPARKEVEVLKGVDLHVANGQTVALVGSSGCGKSTMVQLLQRFYDPTDGKILIDGTDIRELNVAWLRQHIGIVSQEPVLFATTIAENIRYGRENVTDDEIRKAAQMANAHDFISSLPDKYETLVGERGAQLSGGQKQRVAIARALVRDPRILLLDEATSALDTESEAIVQEALDKARAGRTTIVIAHRLSTIKTADSIAGFKEGEIVERGTHDQLMAKNGVYKTLVTMQTHDRDEEEEDIIAAYIDDGKKPAASHGKLKRLLSTTSDVGSAAEEEEDTTGDKKDKKKKKKKKKEEKEESAPFSRVIRLNSPEWPLILFGTFCSILNGGVQPAFAVIFAEVIGVFAEDEETQKKNVAMYSLILVGIGAGSFFAMLGQAYLFGKSGECLTLRIRQMVFRAMLRQDISWFDDHKNSTGALTTRLATDASMVHGAAGARIGGFFQALANMGTAIVIAFIYGWKLTLVIFAFLPVIAIAGMLEMKMLTGVAGQNKEALEDAGKVATEAIENIRTVASLSKEPKFLKLYIADLEVPYKAALRKAHLVGLAFSLSQAVLFFAYAAAFYFGAYLIKENEMNFVDVFKVFSAIVFGAMAVGQASAFAPDASKAGVSAAAIFKLLDQEPKINWESDVGQKPAKFSSAVSFRNTKFHYPTRPDIKVLQGLNLNVAPGETLALVGASGCGKSTTVQLIERFYDPDEGSVILDQIPIPDLNIQWLREQIGIVSQEPILFDCSIAENIAYGDNTREIPMDEIIAAARNANIHEFISSLPDGYETSVGDKGTQLSGGQKQRVAIARALVRNPKILLLDEATSALDTESEKVVQEALDKAREGRTCIVIAHRLSTIQNADKICVIKHGQVAEEGRHSDLMGKQGIYYKLQSAQARKK